MEPFNVNIDNQGQVWQNLYGDISETKVKRPVFKINDKVRISKWKGRFDKGYENNWSIEIFIIYKILPRNPFVYMLKDLKGEIIEGTFYEKEIQKVTESGYFPLEKILKKRKRNIEYFVKFLGYPQSFNTWVTE
ncbi:chromo domain-containing protein [Trichonephila clavipes]|nr:chromo domain-containing protein [Trichonephila clavipes]